VSYVIRLFAKGLTLASTSILSFDPGDSSVQHIYEPEIGRMVFPDLVANYLSFL